MKNLEFTGADGSSGSGFRYHLNYDEQRTTYVFQYKMYDDNENTVETNLGLLVLDTALTIQRVTYLEDSTVYTLNISRFIAGTPDGGILLSTGSPTPTQRYDKVTKLDSEGNVLWTKIIPDTLKYRYNGDMIPTHDGNFIMSSYLWSINPLPPFGWRDVVMLTKITPDADIIWQKYLPPTMFPTGAAPLMTPLHNGGFAYLFLTDSLPSEGAEAYRLYGIDSLANRMWQSDWRDFTQAKSIRRLRTTANGDIIGCGIRIGQNLPTHSTNIGWVFKVSKDGQRLWDRFYSYEQIKPESDWTIFDDILETSDGRLALTGSVDNEPLGLVNPILVVLDENGCLDPNNCPNGYNYFFQTSALPPVPSVLPLTLSPNPAFETLNLTLPSTVAPDGLYYEILSINGKIMESGRLLSSTSSITVLPFPPGLYTLLLRENGRLVGAGRFVVQK